MVLRGEDPVLVLMRDVANEATEVLDVLGNVWSETRLNNRDVMTRISVATFSGASYSARRTKSKCKATSLQVARDAPSLGDIKVNTSEAESNSATY